MKANKKNPSYKNNDLPVPIAGFTFQANFEPALGLRPTPLPPVNTLSSSSAGQHIPRIHYFSDDILETPSSAHHYLSTPLRPLPSSSSIAPVTFGDSISNYTDNEHGSDSIIDTGVIFEDSQSDSQGIGFLRRLIHTPSSLGENPIQHKVIETPSNLEQDNLTLSRTNNTGTTTDIVKFCDAHIQDNSLQACHLESNIQFQYHSNILLQRLHSMMIRQEYCDIKIIVEDMSWYCHVCVLASASPLLHELLLNKYKHDSCSKLVMKLPSTVDKEVFGNILQMMYTGKLTLAKSNVFKILYIAESLKLNEVHKKCCEFVKSFDGTNSYVASHSRHNDLNFASMLEISSCQNESFDSDGSIFEKRNEEDDLQMDSTNTNTVFPHNEIDKTVLRVEEDVLEEDTQDKGCFEDLVKAASELVNRNNANSSSSVQQNPSTSNMIQSATSSEEGNISCRICGKTFTNHGEKVEHISNMHGWDKTTLRKRCGICRSTFKTSKQLQKHCLTKHTGNRFQCRFCDLQFKQLLKCQHHERSVHIKEVLYSCSVCAKGFYIHQHYKRHMKSHEGSEQFKCHICGKILTSKLGYDNHLTAMHGDKKWVCTFPNCNGKFGNEKALQRHVSNHTRSNEFECDECQQKFKFSSHLKRHKDEVHADESCRTFACDQCNLRFHRPTQLKAHMVSHTDRRDHICNICHKTFKHKASLYIHQKKHSGVCDYVCDICGLSFFTKTYLKAHSVKHSSESPHLCQICGHSFKTLKYLRRHMLRHSASDQDAITPVES